MSTLLLIDAHAMIHRAYHALPSTFTSADGTPTNAIYGFFMMIQKVVTDFRPTHIAVCFDTPKPTFRKQLLPEYQSKRPAMEDALKVQIPIIRHMLRTSGISCFEMPGYEADDVIGTLAEKLKKQTDHILILTGDRDILQLAADNVNVIAPKKGVTEFTLFTRETIKEKMHVLAEQIPDYKALAGDSSDNYHAAPGIGPKTAATLLTSHPTIEHLFDHLESVTNLRWRTVLNEYKEKIILLKKIATIVRDLDIPIELNSLKHEGYALALQDELKKYQLFTLINTMYPQQNKSEKKKENLTVAKPQADDQPSLF